MSYQKMKVQIEVHLIIEGTGYLRRGPLDVDPVEYVQDPETAIIKTAYEFISEIKSRTGYRETVIEKVIYDGKHDITELVRNYRPFVDDSILPF